MITFKERKSLKDYDSVSLAAILRDHFRQEFPVDDLARLDDAIQVASYLHRHKVRNGYRGASTNPPYIEHPLRVAIRLFRYFDVRLPNVLIAAVLHDTVEDHSYFFSDFEGVGESDSPELARIQALEFIARHFRYGVASAVEAVSNPILPVGTDRDVKVAAYHEHIKSIIRLEGPLILKFSDFVDNAGSLHHHYAYDNPKARYFIERYTPLLKLYREAFETSDESTVYNQVKALARLEDVEKQFGKFHVGLDIPFSV